MVPEEDNKLANSTQIITDLKSVQSTGFSATAKANAIAAAGPIMDLDAVTALLLLKAQEMKAILNYMISPNYMIGGGTLGGAGAVVTSAADATVEGLLAGVLNDLV